MRKEKRRRLIEKADSIREELFKTHGYFSPSAGLIREDRESR